MKMIWSLDKIEYLKQNYNNKSAKELAQYLNCSDKAVYQKAFKLGLKGRTNQQCFTGTYRTFSAYEVDFTKANYADKGPQWISVQLNRSKSAIQKIAAKLKLSTTVSVGLKNSSKHSKNIQINSKKLKQLNEEGRIFKTGEDVEYAIRLYEDGLSIPHIANMLNCSTFPLSKILGPLEKRLPSDYDYHRCHHQFGDKNSGWKGGMKSIYDRFRDLKKYSDWRTLVFERDGYKCTKCDSDGPLNAHHIKYLKTLIDEYVTKEALQIQYLTEKHLLNDYFYDLSNGTTLCESCHKDHHKEHGCIDE